MKNDHNFCGRRKQNVTVMYSSAPLRLRENFLLFKQYSC